MLRGVRIWSLNLHKALRTDGLIAASSLVKIRRVIQEADRTFGCVLV
jgi:hypothetical protein